MVTKEEKWGRDKLGVWDQQTQTLCVCVCVCVCVWARTLSCISHVPLFTPWTVAHQAHPLSMGFSTQEFWSGLPCPPPGDLPNPGIEPTSLMSPALTGGFFNTSSTWEAYIYVCVCVYVYVY